MGLWAVVQMMDEGCVERVEVRRNGAVLEFMEKEVVVVRSWASSRERSRGQV